MLLLTAQLSLAGSATWLSSPQDSAWENPNNWTPGGPPNGPSDVATFAASYRSSVNISTPVEVDGIVFTANQDFGIYVRGSELTFSGTGVTNNSGTYQSFWAEAGQIIFNNTSTAGDAVILALGSRAVLAAKSSLMIHRLPEAQPFSLSRGILEATAVSFSSMARRLVAPRGEISTGSSGATVPALLDIRGHQSGVTVGSIEGGGDVYLGANDLTVGTNNYRADFYGVIENFGQGGSLAKVGSGILTLQRNTCIADTVGLILVSGSIINLDFPAAPDVIASLVVDGVRATAGYIWRSDERRSTYPS